MSQEPLVESKGKVEAHWKTLRDELNKVLPDKGKRYQFIPTAIAGATAVLISEPFRRQIAIRERGGETPIFPLLLEEESAMANYWASLHQKWDEDKHPNSRKLIYNTTSITVYFGPEHSSERIQLFRAEWPGVRMQGPHYVLEAPGAGHPHWHFDAYQDVIERVEERRERLAETIRVLSDAPESETEELTEMVIEDLKSTDQIGLRESMKRLTRVHFASDARWHQQPWDGDEKATDQHARGPANLKEIQNWTVSTLIYLGRELSRGL